MIIQGFYNLDQLKELMGCKDDRTVKSRLKKEGIETVEMFGADVISTEDLNKIYESKKNNNIHSTYKAKNKLSKL